ncbi:MAG: 2-oxo acid dehydrogenase subunit E2 [Nitrospirae bacterium]|nr:MAG: 2-oxo acid dehydrogenase subunit E2 [Nitrospirota bacterium]
MTRVVMPKLTDTMEEGIVVAWKKQEGDPVAVGDVLAEIETDKAVMDLEAFGSGFLRKILVPEGQAVKAGALIAVIGELDDDIDAVLAEATSESRPPTTTPSPQASPPIPTKPSPEAPPVSPPSAPPTETPVVAREKKISPRAKALAEEHGLDISTLVGSGPGGRIVERDVLNALQAAPGATAHQPIVRPLSQMRKAIARVTTESKAPVPHFYLTTEISMAEAERLRKQVATIRQTPLSLTALLVRAATLALQHHPDINVSFAGEALHQHTQIDIGVAVALDDGLITPVIRDCAQYDILTISDRLRTLIERAKAKHLAPEEYTGATFSISNLGPYGVHNFIAVLMPPQAASLAVGTVRSVPVVKDEAIVSDRRMQVTLSCDHRALDGAQGAQFLQTFKRVLEQPLELFLPLAPPSEGR